MFFFFFFFQAEDGIRDATVTGVQTCALPISPGRRSGLSGTATESHFLHRGVCPRTGPTPGDAAVSGACTLTSVPVRGPEGDAGRRPRVRAEEPSLRRDLSSGRSAHARRPAAGPPARLENETNQFPQPHHQFNCYSALAPLESSRNHPTSGAFSFSIIRAASTRPAPSRTSRR